MGWWLLALQEADLRQLSFDIRDALVELVVRTRQPARPFQGLDRGHPLTVLDRRFARCTRRDSIFGVELERVFEGLGGAKAVAVVEECAAQADPRRDIPRVVFETLAEYIDRFRQLAFAAKVLAELEEIPGGRILPDFKAKLLESIVHEILNPPGPAARRVEFIH